MRALPEPVHTTSADGTRIATYDFGPGHSDDNRDPGTDIDGGGDLLLAHATGLCAGVWLPLAAALSEYRVATFDARGHGLSEEPTTMDWLRTAEDVLATVDALGLERPFGVGHSMGGASLLLAELARPGTFRGLWVFEPIVFPSELRSPHPEANPLSEGALRRRDVFPSAEEAYANFASKAPFRDVDPEALRGYVDHGFEELDDGTVRLRCRPEFEARTYQMGNQHDASDRLGEIACPVTVVRGGDGGGAAMLAPLAADAIPGSMLEEIGTVGHFGPIEDTAATAASISRAVTAAS